jgi:hypothetical protein
VLIVPKEGCMTPTLLEKRGLFKSIWVDTMTPRLLLFIKMGLKLQAKQSKAKQSQQQQQQKQRQGPKPSIIEAEGGHLCLLLQTRTLNFLYCQDSRSQPDHYYKLLPDSANFS